MVDRSYGYRETMFFGLWVLPISLGLLLLKPDVYCRLDQPYALIAVFLPLIILLASILASIIQRVKGLRETLSLYGRLPVRNALLILLMVTSTILFRSKLYHILMVSVFPFGFNPLFQTIGELQKLGLIGWGLWPGVFWILISIGLLLIVWDICKALKLHQLWTLGLVEIIVFGIAFSRLSSGISGANFIETNLTLAIYWGSLGIGILGLIIGFIHAYLKRRRDPLSVEYTVWIKVLLVVWSILTLICMRAAIRFTYLFALPGAILGGYAIIWLFKRYVRKEKWDLLYLPLIASILWQLYALLCKIEKRFLILPAYTLLTGLTILLVIHITKYITRGNHLILRRLGLTVLILYMLSINSISFHPAFGGYAFSLKRGASSLSLIKMTGAEEALRWIQKNTNENAVIAANWELGSWINLLSNRATIVDEQQREYWTYLMARYLFMGDNISRSH